VLPTDTVYGVAADAFDGPAVRRLLRAKGRGRNMPPPVLVSTTTTLESLASGVPSYAREMIDELWPGPLTLVCTQQPSLTWDLGDNRSTVAIRMPDHPVAIELLERTGPLAVSSANRTGMPAARTIEEAEEMLGDRVRVYLDGGPSSTDVASTILDVTGPRPRVLRRGGITLARLREFDKRTYTSVSDFDVEDAEEGSDQRTDGGGAKRTDGDTDEVADQATDRGRDEIPDEGGTDGDTDADPDGVTEGLTDSDTDSNRHGRDSNG
jgi:tRNA threonylcarbamoyl adenosine modification protein (Sua5/YciO/YrdC/YwlC family)